jgi:hypothetical protein
MPSTGQLSMSKLKLLALSTLTFQLCSPLHAQSRANTAQLPAGPIENKARTACTICHDGSIIVQQRLSKTLWGKEVDKMIGWGAIVNRSDRDALVEYFSTNFSPEKPAYVAPRSTPQKR